MTKAAVTRLPLLASQRTALAIDAVAGGGPEYNVVWAGRLFGSLSVDTVRRALDTVALKHPALRTSLHDDAREPQQSVGATSIRRFEVTNSDPIDAADAGLSMSHVLEREWRRRFDLRDGPPWRAALTQLGPADHLLTLTAHQAICDCWSAELVARDLASTYTRLLGHGTARTDTTDADYMPYVTRLAGWQREAGHSALTARLRQQLRAVAGVRMLPAARPCRSAATIDGERYHTSLDTDHLAELDRFAREERVTFVMVLLGALAAVMSRRMASASHAVIGCPTTNRYEPSARQLAGPLTNLVVVSIPIANRESFRALTRRVKVIAREALRFRDISLASVVPSLGAESASGAPPVQVVLSTTDAATAGVDFGDLTLERIDAGVAPGRFELTVHVERTAHGLDLCWTFRRHALGRQTVEELAQDLVRTLQAGCASPDATVFDLAES